MDKVDREIMRLEMRIAACERNINMRTNVMPDIEQRRERTILRNEFDQISRVEIPKNIANAFIELKNSLRVYPQEKRKEITEEKASQMKSEINEFIDRLTGTVGEENEMEGQKNTMGATIRLQGSEEYIKRMQEIKQVTRELREESERLNQSLERTVKLLREVNANQLQTRFES